MWNPEEGRLRSTMQSRHRHNFWVVFHTSLVIFDLNLWRAKKLVPGYNPQHTCPAVISHLLTFVGPLNAR